VNCRLCDGDASLPFVDLGSAPPSNAFLTAAALRAPETWYPLRVMTCTTCWLVQTEDVADRAQFFVPDYAYFSSFSATWLRHAETYVTAMFKRFSLGSDSLVIEVASNDGYLLQYVRARGARCVGIEPTAGPAEAARGKGIEVVQEFFGRDVASRLAAAGQADLMTANNVLAHVPDINDFVAGFAALLKPTGVATFEFPHLLKLVHFAQFDTIYHEHFSYLSFATTARVFARNGLSIFDVEELPTHGGSLRVYAQRTDTGQHPISARVTALSAEEAAAGITTAAFYSSFQQRADRVKNDFLSFLIAARRKGMTVSAYGAAAKGNTLMNYAGIRPDLLSFVVDRNPAKQGKFMPGSRIPIVDEDHFRAERPGYVVILPWNLEAEIAQQLSYAREWNCRLVVAIPALRAAVFQTA
jgi:SAM-dependent methyltransferase